MTKTAAKSEKDAFYEKYFEKEGIKGLSILTVGQLMGFGAVELKAGKDVMRLKENGWLPYAENAEHDLIVELDFSADATRLCTKDDPGNCVFARQFQKLPGVKEVLVLVTVTYLMYADGRQVKYMNPTKMAEAIRKYDATSSIVNFETGEFCMRAPREREQSGTRIHHGKTTTRDLVVVAPSGEKWPETFAGGGHREAFKEAEKKYPKADGYSVVPARQKSSRGEFLFKEGGGRNKNAYRFDPVVDSMDIDNPANAESVHQAAKAKACEELRKKFPMRKRLPAVKVVIRSRSVRS